MVPADPSWLLRGPWGRRGRGVIAPILRVVCYLCLCVRVEFPGQWLSGRRGAPPV